MALSRLNNLLSEVEALRSSDELVERRLLAAEDGGCEGLGGGTGFCLGLRECG